MNKGKIEYRAMQLRYCVRRFAYKAGKQEYLPKSALNRDEFNTVISNLILSGKPIMVGRFGSQEARATAWALGVAKGYDKAIPLYVQKRMAVGPGFFPADDEHIRRFGLLMAKSAADLDALAYWDSFMQQWLLKEVCAEGITISYLENLEPYRNQGNPWTAALSGKRVLVVDPFAKSIEAQYSRKEQLFANRNLLPDFELQTLVPPQTIAGSADARYTDWFDALKHLEFEVDSREFDVAIIGCGAYGFPLASHVKRSGRQAIHGGGWSRCFSASRGSAGTSNLSPKSFTTQAGSGRVWKSGLNMRMKWRTDATGKARQAGAGFHG